MTQEETITQIKKNLKADKLLLGTNSCMKSLKAGKLSQVLLSSNCPKEVTEDICHYSDLQGVEVVKLDIQNDELGILCKRQHRISVLGVLK